MVSRRVAFAGCRWKNVLGCSVAFLACHLRSSHSASPRPPPGPTPRRPAPCRAAPPRPAPRPAGLVSASCRKCFAGNSSLSGPSDRQVVSPSGNASRRGQAASQGTVRSQTCCEFIFHDIDNASRYQHAHSHIPPADSYNKDIVHITNSAMGFQVEDDQPPAPSVHGALFTFYHIRLFTIQVS